MDGQGWQVQIYVRTPGDGSARRGTRSVLTIRDARVRLVDARGAVLVDEAWPRVRFTTGGAGTRLVAPRGGVILYDVDGRQLKRVLQHQAHGRPPRRLRMRARADADLGLPAARARTAELHAALDELRRGPRGEPGDGRDSGSVRPTGPG